MLAESLVNVRVREINGAGHMSPLTHPDAVNRAIVEHIEAMSSQRPMAA